MIVGTKTICVVVPCYNEAAQLGKVLTTLPEFVTHVCVIDDCSTDQTSNVARDYHSADKRIHLIRHETNQGVGGAIATGYKWARDENIDVAVVMAGDAQMNPEDLPALLKPVIAGEVDYAKGNRLFHEHANRIPRVRLVGNSILSLLTKIASGYWHIADSQCGYTAINKHALHHIEWENMYKGFGQPNDLLVLLNVHNMRVRDIEVEPLYNIGERSGFRSHRVIWPIALLLVRRFLWRLKEKYILKDFHPLVLFYALAFTFAVLTILFFIRLLVVWVEIGSAPTLSAMATMFCAGTSLQSLFFAMWMDMEANKQLR